MSARTYNQEHRARPYTRERRRVSVYVAWSFPGEANRDLTELDDRFSTMTEVRRAFWPEYEAPQWSDPRRFQQGIAGSLELFFWSWVSFQRLVEEVTGHAVPLFQRVDQAGFSQPLDERVTGDADTLLVFGLDHDVTEQSAAPDELAALRSFLAREGTCLVLCPHHDVGRSGDRAEQAVEHAHHGDALVPPRQRFGAYTRSLLQGLGVAVEPRWALRPAVVPGSTQSAPLTVARDLDTKGWLTGVERFNFHPHLPHYAVAEDARDVRVLARQPIDRTRPHPFTAAGNAELNALVWLPPGDERAGDVLVADSTIFSTLFGRDESLERFWQNLAKGR